MILWLFQSISWLLQTFRMFGIIKKCIDSGQNRVMVQSSRMIFQFNNIFLNNIIIKCSNNKYLYFKQIKGK